MSSGGKPVVLLAFANPDPRRPLRNLSREERGIRAALEPLVAREVLDEPVTIWDASMDAVVGQLQKERFRTRVRVFHYGGHADEVMLLLADDAGAPAAGHAAGLADYLGQQQGLELVVLNGCSTRAQIERLREVGVKAVVATSQEIMDDVAADFAAKLYAELTARPLEAAFDAATAALRAKGGEDPRAFVHEDAPGAEEWDEEWPWVLSCAKEHAGWRLVPEAEPLGGLDEQELVDHLARVVHDKGTASVLMRRIQFPPGRAPEFDTSLVFWTRVVDALRSGAVEAKEQALVDAVAKMFPGNEFFGRHRTRGRS